MQMVHTKIIGRRRGARIRPLVLTKSFHRLLPWSTRGLSSRHYHRHGHRWSHGCVASCCSSSYDTIIVAVVVGGKNSVGVAVCVVVVVVGVTAAAAAVVVGIVCLVVAHVLYIFA